MAFYQIQTKKFTLVNRHQVQKIVAPPFLIRLRNLTSTRGEDSLKMISKLKSHQRRPMPLLYLQETVLNPKLIMGRLTRRPFN